MAGFTDEQKALIREIAWEVSDAIKTRIDEHHEQQLKLHLATCPHGKRIDRIRWGVAGAIILWTVLAGGGAILLKVLL